MKGIIYKLTSGQTEKVCIQYTFDSNLNQLLYFHKIKYMSYTNHQGQPYNDTYDILQYPDCKAELIEEYECENNSQLRKRAQYHIVQYNNVVNKANDKLTREKYNLSHQNEIKEQQRNYRIKHIDQVRERQKKYRDTHKEQIKKEQKVKQAEKQAKISKELKQVGISEKNIVEGKRVKKAKVIVDI